MTGQTVAEGIRMAAEEAEAAEEVVEEEEAVAEEARIPDVQQADKLSMEIAGKLNFSGNFLGPSNPMEASKKIGKSVLKACNREVMPSRSIYKSFAKKEAKFLKKRSYFTNTAISTNVVASKASARTPPREKSNLIRSLKPTG